MKRVLLSAVLVTLFVLALSSTAFAYYGGFGSGQTGPCIRESLTDDQQAQFNEVIEKYRADMLKLREEMHALRDAGDSENFGELRENRFALMEAKREELSEFLPEEFAEHFQNFGGGMRNFGGEKGSGCFSR